MHAIHISGSVDSIHQIELRILKGASIDFSKWGLFTKVCVYQIWILFKHIWLNIKPLLTKRSSFLVAFFKPIF